MYLKRIAVLAAMASSLTLATVGAAFADTPTPTPASSRPVETLADVKARVDHRFGLRFDVLNRLVTRLQSDSRLSATDKSLLLSEDQAAITGLTALKAKADAETTIAAVRADEGQITSFHVLDVLVPQNRELISVNNLQATAGKLTTLVADVQTKINTLQTSGVNVSSIQALLTDASTKLQTIDSLLANDQKSLEGMTPTTFGTAATFSQVRQDIGTARSDFLAVRSDFRQIKTDITALKATPTPTPTP